MKNYLCVCILVIAVCTGSFAEDAAQQNVPGESADSGFSLSLESAWDLLHIRAYTGDYGKQGANDIYKYQGDTDISAFQSSAFDDPLISRINFALHGKKMGASVQIRANSDTGFAGNWDWQGWVRPFEFLKVATGNTAQRGQIAVYQNFSDFLKTKVDQFGVMVPEWAGVKEGEAIHADRNDPRKFPYNNVGDRSNYGFDTTAFTDTDDLSIPAGSFERRPMNLLIQGLYGPLTLSLSAGGLFSFASPAFENPWEWGTNSDDINDPPNITMMNFGARVEWVSFLEILTMSAVYKYSGSVRKKTEAADPANVADERVENHAFGVYAGIEFGQFTPLLNGLAASAGYAGLFKSWENPDYEKTDLPGSGANTQLHWMSNYRRIGFPYYNGVDLRVNYTGVKQLVLTFNNNVSFAGVQGSGNKKERYVIGWAYYNYINHDNDQRQTPFRVEYYLGLYNALGIKYQVTKDMDLDIQFANQFHSYTLIWQKPSAHSSTNSFGAYAGSVYRIKETRRLRTTIAGGLSMRLNSFSYQNPEDMSIQQAGYLDCGIPLNIKIEF